MYAVIETGGKQYRVEVGTELEVELLDAEPGKTITLERVLLVADGDDANIGRPLVSGAEVSAEVLRQARGEKIISFKYRPKARSRVKKGHRQELTILRISDIVLGGKSAAKAAAKAEADAKTERQRLEEAAAAQAAKDAELAAKLARAEGAGEEAPRSRTKATSRRPRPTANAAKARPPATTRSDGQQGDQAAKPSRRGQGRDREGRPRRPRPRRAAAAKKPAAPKPRATKKDE